MEEKFTAERFINPEVANLHRLLSDSLASCQKAMQNVGKKSPLSGELDCAESLILQALDRITHAIGKDAIKAFEEIKLGD